MRGFSPQQPAHNDKQEFPGELPLDLLQAEQVLVHRDTVDAKSSSVLSPAYNRPFLVKVSNVRFKMAWVPQQWLPLTPRPHHCL